jgi:AcrR family transcriptional regulator
MGRKSLKDVRSKEIIEAFYKLAKKEGLENASMAKTAEIIDMNPSLIVHYFKTKEYLVYGLIEFILDKYLLIFGVPAAIKNDPEQTLLKVIDNIFSDKWNKLFDDSVSYSCYALAFRDEVIKEKYKNLLDTLRERLVDLIVQCNKTGKISVKDPVMAADMIFVLVDGAYYYLSLVKNKQEYKQKIARYKEQALEHLQFATSPSSHSGRWKK